MKKRLFFFFIVVLMIPAIACCTPVSPLDASDPIIKAGIDFLASQGYVQVRTRSKDILAIPEAMNAPAAEIFYLQDMSDEEIAELRDRTIYDVSVDILNHGLSRYALSTGETNVHVWISEGNIIGGSSAPYVYVYDEENPYVPGEEIPEDQPTALSADYIWNLYGQNRHTLNIQPPVRTPYPLDSFGNTMIPTPTPVPTPTPDPATVIDEKTVNAYAAVIEDMVARKSELNGPMDIIALDMMPLEMTNNEMNYLVRERLASHNWQIVIADLQRLYNGGHFDADTQSLGNYLLITFSDVVQSGENLYTIHCEKFHSQDEYMIMVYTMEYVEEVSEDGASEGRWIFTDKQEMTVQ